MKTKSAKSGTRRATCANTPERILKAATRVFAAHGYREATTRMICAEAQVNIALVNYHFHSKAELYQAVIARLFGGTGGKLLSLCESVHDAASWRAAIQQWVEHSLSICAARKAPGVWVARLIGMEEAVPSALAQDIEAKFTQPVRHAFRRLLRMGMAEDDEVQVGLWAASVNAQCGIYALTQRDWAARFCPEGVTREAWLKLVAAHICEGIFARLSYHGERA